jgi:pimeloyl-ACP methyl ester carboxylesterase
MDNLNTAVSRRCVFTALLAAPGAAMMATAPNVLAETSPKEAAVGNIRYLTQKVDDVEVYYREAGPTDAPVVLLLHGFPTSGHMFRDLIPELSDRYRIIAPDLPGFGLTKSPPRGQFAYTFDSLAKVVNGFVEAVGLRRYAIYIFDYGAPTGLRLAMAHPERVSAIITQNGNAYVEGLSEGWNPIQKYWKDPSDANRQALRDFLKPDSVRWQYLHGVPDQALVSPDGSSLDSYYLGRAGIDEIQLDLFLDYRSNVALYPTFQAYFRKEQPPLLATWGKNDPFFLPPGAEAYKRDLPKAEVHFFDTGHFALETHHRQIATLMRDFLGRHG